MRQRVPTRQSILRSTIGIAAAALSLFAPSNVNKAVSDPTSIASDPQLQHIVTANTDFGFRLLHQLGGGSGNVFVSPFSITQALSLTLNGAGEPTYKQMSSALGLQSLSLDQVNQGNGRLRPLLVNPNTGVELSIANALWVNTTIKLDPGFQVRCTKYYQAGTTRLDLHAPAAANTINNWVKDKTHNKIDKLVGPEDLQDSALVLTNAVYFHGSWSQQFQAKNTNKGPFTLKVGVTKTLPLMSEMGRFGYAETPTYQAISLPYASGRTSFYVVLPKSGGDIDTVVKAMDPAKWQYMVGSMKSTRVDLQLPRFKVAYSTTLNAPLSGMGMGAAFQSGSNFRPMGEGIKDISAVIHKSILEVTEQGTVAAAVTGVVMRSSVISRPETAVIMHVDHPFFCAIRDNTTGTMLFMGVIRDPQ